MATAKPPTQADGATDRARWRQLAIVGVGELLDLAPWFGGSAVATSLVAAEAAPETRTPPQFAYIDVMPRMLPSESVTQAAFWPSGRVMMPSVVRKSSPKS